MTQRISVGLMEQAQYRNGVTDADAVRNVLSKVSHVEFKYLYANKQSFKAVREYGRHVNQFLLHVQYPGEGQGSLNLIDPQFRQKLDAVGLVEIVKRVNPKWASFHLGFAAEKLQTSGQYANDIALSATLPREIVMEKMVDNLIYVSNGYPNLNLALENLDYAPPERSNGAYEYITDHDFIKEVIKNLSRVGVEVYIVLDQAHGWITAMHKGLNPLDYFGALPLERVREMHLAGPGKREDGSPLDSHELLVEDDMEMFSSLLATGRLTSLEAVTIEIFEDAQRGVTMADVGKQIDMVKATLRKCNIF